MTQEMMLTAALRYARRGWHVFPAPPGAKKSYKSAANSGGRKWGKTRDLEEIRQDFSRWPDANVGLPTGADSGFWVLEADTHAAHGVDGIASLKNLEERHGALPPTRMAASPSGSVHYYWQWVDGEEVKNSASRVAPGVDVRGEGGMVIAPPSVRGDGQYRWLNDLEPVRCPQWLTSAVLQAGRRQSARQSATTDVERLRRACTYIPNEDLNWEEWNTVGMALFAATCGSDAGRKIFHEWSEKSRKYDAGKTDAKWDAMHMTPPTSIGAGTIYFRATEACPGWDRISLDDFLSYLPSHDYIFVPTRDHWPAVSVDSQVPRQALFDAQGQPILDSQGNQKRIKASQWLDRHRCVTQITWAPGRPTLIKDSVVMEGGLEERPGTSTFNRYRPPHAIRGEPLRCGPWLDHCDKVLGEEGRRHVVSWLAHRVQRPQEKINHALVIGGAPGIGKDTLLEPVKRAVGHWNFAEASPAKMLSSFNASYLEAVILRINEARDLGDLNRYSFYEHMKTFTASPPDVLRVNEKFVKEYSIFNCVAIIYTTNYKNGLYLPADDRRHYVVWSSLTGEDFDASYWSELWDWYDSGGDYHVASYLMNLDVSGFNAKAAPPRTAAFMEMVGSNEQPEDDDLADALDQLGNPVAVTVQELKDAAGFGSDLETWLSDRKSRKAIPHKLERKGYILVKNPESADGVWRISNKRTQVYARVDAAVRDQVEAAKACKTRIEASRSQPRVVPGGRS